MLVTNRLDPDIICHRCGRPAPRPAAVYPSTTRSTTPPTPRDPILSDGDAIPQASCAIPQASCAIPQPVCGDCRDAEHDGRPSPIDDVVPLYVYHGLISAAIVASKQRRGFPIATGLAGELADELGRRWTPPRSESGRRWTPPRSQSDRPDTVTFVPSHWYRRMRRGGNSTEAMATVVAKRHDLPMVRCLRLTRAIDKQAWLDDSARRENVRGAFAASKSYAWFENRHVCLIDHVMTSGSTSREIASVLKSVGVRRVTVAVVARAIRG